MLQYEILNIYWFDRLTKESKIKIIKHTWTWIKDFDKVLSNSKLFEEYQWYQDKDIFKWCKYIISYWPLWLFKWIYEIISKNEVLNQKVSKNLVDLWHKDNYKGFFYKFKKINDFLELEDRLVIKWWNSRQYHQWFNKDNDKEVLEIKYSWFVKDFPWYFDIILSFSELKKIIDNKESNIMWYNKLSWIYAIYLIIDKKTWNQYIWSAYWKDWLWWRWEEYSKTFHWWNIELINLINKWEDYQLNFQYTILHVLSATKGSDIFYYENLYKKKLWSKVFWLNKN